MTETLGTRIRQARDDAGLTQEQLAPKLGVTLRTLQRWENDHGKRGVTMSQLYVVARVTGKPLTFFLEEEGAAA